MSNDNVVKLRVDNEPFSFEGEQKEMYLDLYAACAHFVQTMDERVRNRSLTNHCVGVQSQTVHFVATRFINTILADRRDTFWDRPEGE